VSFHNKHLVVEFTSLVTPVFYVIICNGEIKMDYGGKMQGALLLHEQN
jgi:hypothetical protein